MFVGDYMKKCILVITLLLLCGCTNINNASVQDITKEVLGSKINSYNEYRTGYKYYLPQGLNVNLSKKYNEILNDDKYKYYLYVDLVSYLKKTELSYKVNENAYLSMTLDDKGYLEINEKNDKYLIEIMYNYAKIEVIVEKEDINKCVTNALIVLSTITYTDDIVKNLLSIDEVTSSEEKFSVFDEDASDSNFLEVYKEYGNYEGDDKVPDLDVIK